MPTVVTDLGSNPNSGAVAQVASAAGSEQLQLAIKALVEKCIDKIREHDTSQYNCLQEKLCALFDELEKDHFDQYEDFWGAMQAYSLRLLLIDTFIIFEHISDYPCDEVEILRNYLINLQPMLQLVRSSSDASASVGADSENNWVFCYDGNSFCPNPAVRSVKWHTLDRVEKEVKKEKASIFEPEQGKIDAKIEWSESEATEPPMDIVLKAGFEVPEAPTSKHDIGSLVRRWRTSLGDQQERNISFVLFLLEQCLWHSNIKTPESLQRRDACMQYLLCLLRHAAKDVVNEGMKELMADTDAYLKQEFQRRTPSKKSLAAIMTLAGSLMGAIPAGITFGGGISADSAMMSGTHHWHAIVLVAAVFLVMGAAAAYRYHSKKTKVHKPVLEAQDSKIVHTLAAVQKLGIDLPAPVLDGDNTLLETVATHFTGVAELAADVSAGGGAAANDGDAEAPAEAPADARDALRDHCAGQVTSLINADKQYMHQQPQLVTKLAGSKITMFMDVPDTDTVKAKTKASVGRRVAQCEKETEQGRGLCSGKS